jgi:hypothetical protein
MPFEGQIEFFDCATLSDVELAVKEALARIVAGNVMGKDSNDTGAFTFNVDGEEEHCSAGTAATFHYPAEHCDEVATAQVDGEWYCDRHASVAAGPDPDEAYERAREREWDER